MDKKFYKESNDAAFKGIFCKESNKDLLKELLESSLERKVEVERIEPNEIPKENIYLRGKTLDAVVKADGEILLIEMNTSHYEGLNRRNAAFAFEKYINETKVSEEYTSMRNIIQLNFTNGLPNDYPLVAKYKLTDKETDLKYIDNLTIYEFNVEKIFNSCYNEGEERYKFIALLNADKEELHKLCKGDKKMGKFEKELNKLNDDKEFRWLMSAEEDATKVNNTILSNEREEGREEGREDKKIEIAKNLIKMNMNTSDIAKATQLSIEEIKKLK